jgi:hypothetical protein
LREISNEENHSNQALGQESGSDNSWRRIIRRQAAPCEHYQNDHFFSANIAITADVGVRTAEPVLEALLYNLRSMGGADPSFHRTSAPIDRLIKYEDPSQDLHHSSGQRRGRALLARL